MYKCNDRCKTKLEMRKNELSNANLKAPNCVQKTLNQHHFAAPFFTFVELEIAFEICTFDPPDTCSSTSKNQELEFAGAKHTLSNSKLHSNKSVF